ncbi:uncharacterized protein LOC144665631 isoform X2 [Oculina patagonica]
MALTAQGEVFGRAMQRTQFDGREIRGQIVEVLLPKEKKKGEKDYSCTKTRSKQIRLKAQTVCLQVGDDNRVVFAGLTMPADVSDGLTKVSEEDEMVVRVLRSCGTSEELVPINDDRKISQAIDIYADFVRIVPPLDEKSNIEALDADVTARHALIGNKHKIAIHPEGLPNVFDSTRPVLRVLRLPTKPIAVVRSAKDFPNIDKDHLIVLEICENLFTPTAMEYSFSHSSPSVRSRKIRDFYDVKISVSQCGKNGKTEVRDGVLFKREPSLDCYRGIVGFWCRFQTGKTRYVVTFSLWKTQTASQTSELLDEKRIAVETSERKIPPRRLANRKQSHLAKPNSADVTSFPARIHCKQTSLPEQSQSHATPDKSHATEGESHPAEETTSAPELRDFYERCLHIRKILLPLRDDGEWEEFDRQAEHFLKEYAEDIDLQIVVALEQGMACCCRNELRSAEEFIKKAMKIVSQASSTLVPLIKGRASYYLASIYRRDEMALGKAQKCIESAKRHLANIGPTLDQGCLACEEGSVLLEYAHKPCVVEQAKESFDRCIELCSRVSSEDTNNLILKEHDLALMKKAMLLLDCFTKSGRENRTIDEGTLIEARQCLDRIKINIVEEMPRIAQVKYHVVRSDQYFREGRIVDAEAHARAALDLSQKYRFDTERTAKVRLDYYSKLLNSNLMS